MLGVVIIGNDQAGYDALYGLFLRKGKVEVCNEAEDDASVVERVKQLSPKLILLDMAEKLPEPLTEALRRAVPDTPIFLLTATYNALLEKAAIASGVTAVFSKLDDLEALMANARAVLQE